MEEIKERVKRTGLLAEGDNVVAGVSGGADSVCLFLVLLELKDKIGFDFSVLHVEHGIRGEESKADARFVERLCEVNGVRFFMKEVDVPSERKSHVSEEETARNLRRAAFFEAADVLYPEKEVKVALAHNADDQAETILLHLVRGTGIKGLGAMEEKKELQATNGRRVTLIRPLLEVERREIEGCLASRGQSYCTDATNGEDAYTRNYLRHHVIPKLRELNEQAIPHMGRTAAVVREVDREIEGVAIEIAREIIINGRLNRVYAAACPEEVRNRVIKSWIYKKNGTVRNVSSTHIKTVDGLLAAANGTRADIPGRFRVRVEGDFLVWEEKTGRNAPDNASVNRGPI